MDNFESGSRKPTNYGSRSGSGSGSGSMKPNDYGSNRIRIRNTGFKFTCTVLLFGDADPHFELDTAAAGPAARRPIREVLRARLRCTAADGGAPSRPVAIPPLLADSSNLRMRAGPSAFNGLTDGHIR